jgi:long-subunit acyl-CoA synthetase (AMP-forming)
LIDPTNPSIYYSHSSAKKLVRQLIAGLHAAGLKRGDAVCIHSFNSITYPLLVLAIIGAGGWSVGTNPSYTKHELNHGVRSAKVKFVFSEPEILPNMAAALKENHIDVGKRLFILDTQEGQTVPEGSGLQPWRTLVTEKEEDWIRFDDLETARDTVIQLYFTSGTTGLPKLAMTTHRNMVGEHTLFYEANPRSYPFKILNTMPLFHGQYPLRGSRHFDY